jgi:hypothetical protein
MAADPKPGMIAEIQGSPAVKNLASQHAFGSCPLVQSAQENAGCSLFPPLLEQPGFSLARVGGPGPMGLARSELPRTLLRRTSQTSVKRKFNFGE